MAFELTEDSVKALESLVSQPAWQTFVGYMEHQAELAMARSCGLQIVDTVGIREHAVLSERVRIVGLIKQVAQAARLELENVQYAQNYERAIRHQQQTEENGHGTGT